MSLSSTPRQIILQEVFDEASLPTEEEVNEYALRIGIDVDNEAHLLDLARDGLMQALPPEWKPCFDKDRKEIYYFNFKTKEAQWEHPLDEVYRNLVVKVRTETSTNSEQIDDDSRTSLKEDLKSFEEASFVFNGNETHSKMKKLEPLSPNIKGIFKKSPSSCVNRVNFKDSSLKTSLHIDEEKLVLSPSKNEAEKKLHDEPEVRIRPNSSDIRNRRNIGPVEFCRLSKQELIISNPLEKLNFLTESRKFIEYKNKESPVLEMKGSDSVLTGKDEGYGTEFSVSSMGDRDFGKKELTLAGGGSVFLKSNKMKSSPSSDLVSSSFSKEELSDGLLSPDIKKPGSDLDPHPKSILRDSTNYKISDKILQSFPGVKTVSKDEIDDERKSVRFKLEKELKINFETPLQEGDLDQHSVSLSSKTEAAKRESSVKSQKELKQIEMDFDDLKLDFGLEKENVMKEERETIVKMEPKKFRPSQSLIDEFREIFDIQPKYNIKLVGDKKKVDKTDKQSDSNSSQNSSIKSISNPSVQENNYVNHLNASKSSKKYSDESEGEDVSTGKSSVKSTRSQDSNLVNIEKQTVKELSSGREKSELSLMEELKKNAVLGESTRDSCNEDVSDSEDPELAYLENIECEINLQKLERKKFADAVNEFEKLKEERSKEAEEEYEIWLSDMEKSFQAKKDKDLERLTQKYEIWLSEKEKEFREAWAEKSRENVKKIESELLSEERRELEKLKLELEKERKQRLNVFREENEELEKKEVELLRKSYQEKLSNHKSELVNQHKQELMKLEKDVEDLFSEQKTQKLKEVEMVRENEALIEVMRLEMKESYQKQKSNLMKEHEMLLENLRQEHALNLEQIKVEFKNEEESVRKAHLNRLDEIKLRVEVTEGRKSEPGETPRSESTEARVFEKVRCEKRLLEDKYKTLKEKYVRLRAEAKSTLDRKKKNKEKCGTESETEKSSSRKTGSENGEKDKWESKRKHEPEKKSKLKNQMCNMNYLYQNVSTEDEENVMSPKNLPHYEKVEEVKELGSGEEERGKEESSGEEKKLETSRNGNETKKKRLLFSRFKAASTSRINSNRSQNKEALSPVENLRRQLKKLEELEDQFPVTTHRDTYMRYPFTDNPQFGSSEIEFFKHRIHLERESIRQAKDYLKSQKKTFENRQRELKQKLLEDQRTKNAIDQIYQEEKELTDMEVSVHRTRALLGEKIIRLRHLEQSLKRVAQPLKKESLSSKSKDLLGRLGVRNQAKEEDVTLSDLSSYSGSSGFSSTDFNDSRNPIKASGKVSTPEQSRQHLKNVRESSEILQSLENLNFEIREIWEVLKKHESGRETAAVLPPPPPLVYGDFGWPSFTLSPPLPFRNTVITSTCNLQRPLAQQYKTQVAGTSTRRQMSSAADSTLLDRTRILRDWLRAARTSSAPVETLHSNQVTL